MVILQKIVSAIMALVMSVFSFIIPPVEIDVLNLSGEVISTGSGSRPYANTPVICRNYSQFETYCKVSGSNELEEYLEEVDKALFDNYCIVAVHFSLADPSCKAYVTSAEYDGKTLKLNYCKAQFVNYVAASVISYDTLILIADKRIKNVELNEGGKQSLDFYQRDDMFGCQIAETSPVAPYYPEEDGCFEGCFIFEDYESWSEFRNNGNWSVDNSIEIGESFFERSNLVVAITTHSSGGYSLYFSDCVESGSNAEIKFYSAYEPGVHTDAENYEAAFVVVSKDVKTADIDFEFIDLPFRIDGKVFFEIVC